MTTISHKTLTGNQLHEPKGADTAAIDKVYVSNGAGSGTWQKLTASQLQTTGNAFGAQLFHVEDQKAAATEGGTATTGSWLTRVLNTTVTNEIASASLAANQIVLPAGTFFVDIRSPFYAVYAAQIRLYNITDGALLLLGSTGFFHSGGGVAGDCSIKGRFTLAGTKTLEIQYRTSSTVSTNGLGRADLLSWGTTVYTQALIWKVG